MSGFEWMIARRYLWSKRRHPFVGVMSFVSVAGISVGVAALITVLAVMNGFDHELQERIIGMRSHVVLEKDGGFRDWRSAQQALSGSGHVRASAPFIEGQALLEKEGFSTGVLIRGIDPEQEEAVSAFKASLAEGGFANGSGVILGSELSKRFRAPIGSTFTIRTKETKKPVTATVTGVFTSGLYEFDAHILFVSLDEAKTLFAMEDAISGLSVAAFDASEAKTVQTWVRESLGYPFQARTWMETNKTLFAALKLEKIVMFLILALIVLVACLNIAGSLTVLVMDKTRDIGVFRALGARSAQLVRLFAVDGLLIGIFGAAIGMAGGSLLCWILANSSFLELPQEIYYVSRLPVLIDPADVAAVLSVAVLLSFLSSLYPAFMAGRLDPVRALRYE